MELKEGYNSLEEQEFFEWHHAEWDRVHSDASMSVAEKRDRFAELFELKSLSQPYRRVEFLPGYRESYQDRLREGRNYYNKRPLHWDSSTNK